jgi:hypothetical protein
MPANGAAARSGHRDDRVRLAAQGWGIAREAPPRHSNGYGRPQPGLVLACLEPHRDALGQRPIGPRPPPASYPWRGTVRLQTDEAERRVGSWWALPRRYTQEEGDG